MINLLKNYPYDNNYDLIKLHSNKSTQKAYFDNFIFITINEYEDEGYVRDGDSFIVEYNYDYLVNEGINYVIWNNGYKDLFCFIVKKEYVDEYNTRLYYDIDVLNTFCFDFNINNSYIERKNCNLNEVTDYDEGLYIGEHVISNEVCTLEKTYKWYAMFNGIKQQKLIFDGTTIKDVINLPSPQLKPNTFIDEIPYPIHFMELKNEYDEPIVTDINIPNNGSWKDGILSSKGFRFIKGFEGFAPNKYQDTGGYWTIAYGVTEHGESSIYNNLVSKQPVKESEAAQISYKLKNENYGIKIKDHLIIGGITQQYQFDALLSLVFNCGVGTINGNSNDRLVWDAIKLNPTNESYIRPIWEKFKTNNGLPGLVARRKAECDMFFNKPYDIRSIGLINSSGVVSGTVTENNGDGWLPI